MFDDPKLQNAGTVPGNLPTGEPEDMFEHLDAAAAPATAPAPAPVPAAPAVPSAPAVEATPLAAPTALSAGILKPRQPLPPPPAPSIQPPSAPLPQRAVPDPGNIAETYQLKEPIGKKSVITWIIVFVLLLVFGGGSLLVYFAVIRTPDRQAVQPARPLDEEPAPTLDARAAAPAPQPAVPPAAENEETPDTADEVVLFGSEVLDTDSDGLDDAREGQLGTDSLNWDTDGDGLSDGDEAIIWKTSPTNEDSDGDTYSDGAEVRNGYNPAGPGRIFEPPALSPAAAGAGGSEPAQSL